MKVAPASIIKPPWNSLTELMALSTKGFLGDGDVNPAVHSHQHLCLLSVFFLILCGFHCKDDNVWIKFLLFFFLFLFNNSNFPTNATWERQVYFQSTLCIH